MAKDHHTPVGMMFCIQRTMLQTDGVYEPWCGGLYVVEAQRRCGLGARLVHDVLATARERGFKKVYLGTDKEHLFRWYTRLGWLAIGNAYDGDHHYRVMEYNL